MSAPSAARCAPAWDAEEQRLAEPVFAAIDACRMPRRSADGKAVVLRLGDAEWFRTGNAGGPPIVLARQLFNALGFDEDRLLAWRIEHKLVQALAIERYRSGVMPVTHGLARVAASRAARDRGLRRALGEMFPGGYYAKTALGDMSGGSPDSDRTDALVASAETGAAREVTQLTDEDAIVQERVAFDREYRVHSFEDRVVPTLSFLRYGGEIVGERDAPNAFVQSVLDALPDGLVGATMLGWDVARVAGGRFAIIEVNVAGHHRYYNPGFQCSGFFHVPGWGRLCMARLMHHLESARGMRIEIVADRPGWPENEFYADMDERRAWLRAAAAQTAGVTG